MKMVAETTRLSSETTSPLPVNAPLPSPASISALLNPSTGPALASYSRGRSEDEIKDEYLTNDDNTKHPDSPTNDDKVSGKNQTSQQKAKRKRITPEQLKELLAMFEQTDTPSFEVRESLSKKLVMTNREIQVWFQNRRAKVNRAKAENAHRFLHHPMGHQAGGSHGGNPGGNCTYQFIPVNGTGKMRDNNFNHAHPYPQPQRLRFQNTLTNHNRPNYKQNVPPPIKVAPYNVSMQPSPMPSPAHGLSPVSPSFGSMQSLLSPLNAIANGSVASQWVSSPTTDRFGHTMTPPSSANVNGSHLSNPVLPPSPSHPYALGLQQPHSISSPMNSLYTQKDFSLNTARTPDPHISSFAKPIELPRPTNSMDILASVAAEEYNHQTQPGSGPSSAKWRPWD